MPGIDRAPHFVSAAAALAAAAICSHFLFVACVTQIFDSQQRATRLHTFTDGLRSVSDWSWRHVTRARVVATAGPLLRSCPRVRLYVRLRVVLAATEAECIGYRSPVDVPVKKSALDGVYMSRPLTSTQPKRKLSVWKWYAPLIQKE